MRLASIALLALTATAAADPIPFEEQKPHAPKCEAANVRREGERCVVCKHKPRDEKQCDAQFQNTAYHYRCDTKDQTGDVTELWCGKPPQEK